MSQPPSRWIGRIFLRRARLVYTGAVGATQPHAHHAFQVVLDASGCLGLTDGREAPRLTRAAVIPPDAVHAIAAPSMTATMFYFDADDHLGRQLRRCCSSDPSPSGWVAAGRRLAAVAPRPPASWCDVDALERAILAALVGPTTRPRPQHPAVTRTLRAIADDATPDLSLRALAASAGLSASRLSHVFSLETGIPLRRHVLWRRLVRAAHAIASAASLTAAAHEGGFVDGAHMNHVFRRMFGLAPSDVHRDVEWIIRDE